MSTRLLLFAILAGFSGTLFAISKKDSGENMAGSRPGKNCEDKKTYLACLLPAHNDSNLH